MEDYQLCFRKSKMKQGSDHGWFTTLLLEKLLNGDIHNIFDNFLIPKEATFQSINSTQLKVKIM